MYLGSGFKQATQGHLALRPATLRYGPPIRRYARHLALPRHLALRPPSGATPRHLGLRPAHQEVRAPGQVLGFFAQAKQ